jgi:hypothetical protein
MLSTRLLPIVLALLRFTASQTISSTDSGGYTGYTLSLTDTTNSTDNVVYETDDTDTSNGAINSASTPPDVYLNASVSVGEIDITVKNLSAKINIDAQVLSLLQFNAGVDVSINRVELLIQNVSAKVELEARLENLVKMINSTLSSIDLNPVIATLGNDVGQLVNTTVGGLTGGSSGSSSGLSARSTLLDEGILYSVNDYVGNAHTNRILDQAGNIIDQKLHNDGTVYASSIVGSYWHDMTPTGHESTLLYGGQNAKAVDYEYAPIPGLSLVARVYLSASGSVLGTQIVSEIEGGGTSTIANDEVEQQ